ncbi:Hypothetical predicted protein [Paramuricea clavata]|uniref:Uncharacterized protein n=1 Tax=Paramuricea clavata TaxID=317549 RepID=A0A7D9HAB6_PARCT|nr:Hypothetical predicted protein [Paramuricea clavata]
MCNISDIKHNNFTEFNDAEVQVAASLFWVDGCLCVLFALLTHFNYTRVTVLNYSVCTPATSNMQWIWFFIFTALSSIMSGLNLWLNRELNKLYRYPVITGWFANLFSILSLVFAVKYQWKCREEAYNDMTTTSVEETTPILFQQNGMNVFLRPSKADVFFVGLFLLSAGFFIAAWIEPIEDKNLFYWIAHSFMWLLQLVIFLMILIIHCTMTRDGPSVFIKCVLMAGVIFNSLSDIPANVWLNCILNRNKDAKGPCYDGFVGLILLSHVAFFFVMKTEFRRLRDVAIWHVADRIDNLETNQSKLQKR